MTTRKKATYVLYHFCDELKFPNQFFLDLTKLLMPGSALTLLTCRYHKNRGSMYVVGELFVIDRQDLSLVGHIC
jgi:hypothetical protein